MFLQCSCGKKVVKVVGKSEFIASWCDRCRAEVVFHDSKLVKKANKGEVVDMMYINRNLELGLASFKKFALSKGLVKDDKDFSDRTAFSIEGNTIKFLLLKEHLKTHTRRADGSYPEGDYAVYDYEMR